MRLGRLVDPAFSAPNDTIILWAGPMNNYTKILVLDTGSLDRPSKIWVLMCDATGGRICAPSSGWPGG
jgi:hypothetical protein